LISPVFRPTLVTYPTNNHKHEGAAMNEEVTEEPETTSEMPSSLYWVAGAALVWNLIGISAYVDQMTMSPEAMAQLTDAQRQYFETRPAWAASAFAIAVNAGALGCLLLLLRKALAYPVLIVSLAGVIVQNLHAYFLSNGWAAFGPAGVGFVGAVLFVGVYLVRYSANAKAQGWIT
jgi:hypothetical protein